MNNLRKPSEVILSDGRTLEEVLELHKKWLNDEKGGERAKLSRENLNHADLRYTNLNYADLTYSNLSFSNLNNANLRYTKFYLTNLYKAKGSFVSLGNIGYRNDTTHYLYNIDKVVCGCFDGTMEEFENKVKDTYEEDVKEYKEYMVAIRTLKELAELNKQSIERAA